MTAIRVITDHEELDNSGEVTHAEIDTFFDTTPWIVVSGTTGAIPSGSRFLRAGPGVTITDGGPDGDIIVSVTSMSTGSTISWMETPAGVADGINKTFVVAHEPVPHSALMFFVNGLLQMQGSDSDYLLSGSTITVNYDYRSGSNIVATYPY
jgi:hypothetical protein